jgi:hypothetical protein
MAKHDPESAYIGPLTTTVHHMREVVHRWGMVEIVDAFLAASAPLAPLGAQLLYVLQPTVRIFTQTQTLNAWANLLESRSGITWLRSELGIHEDITWNSE